MGVIVQCVVSKALDCWLLVDIAFALPDVWLRLSHRLRLHVDLLGADLFGVKRIKFSPGPALQLF